MLETAAVLCGGGVAREERLVGHPAEEKWLVGRRTEQLWPVPGGYTRAGISAVRGKTFAAGRKDSLEAHIPTHGEERMGKKFCS